MLGLSRQPMNRFSFLRPTRAVKIHHDRHAWRSGRSVGECSMGAGCSLPIRSGATNRTIPALAIPRYYRASQMRLAPASVGAFSWHAAPLSGLIAIGLEAGCRRSQPR